MKFLLTAFLLLSFSFYGANAIAQNKYYATSTTIKSAVAGKHAIMETSAAPAALPKPLLRIKMLMNADSVNSDEIVIKLDKQASAKFVNNEDAMDMGGIDPLVGISAFSSDNIPLAIDFLPYPGMQPQVVPLSTYALNSGSYRLERTQLANLPPLYEVWLKDALTGDSLNLRQNTTCQFNIDKNNPATFGAKRFSVVFRQSPDSSFSLLSIIATKNSASSLIGWKVKNEADSTTFGVEKSIDTGKTFASIGNIRSNGSGIYSFVDRKPATGQNQYRLKVQDSQGAASYSSVLTLVYYQQNVSNKMKLFPNPAINDINMDMSPGSNVSYNIKVVNALGAVVKETTSSQTNWRADVSNLKPGSYHVQVINNNNKSVVGTANFIKN
jgi:hypothetical protein